MHTQEVRENSNILVILFITTYCYFYDIILIVTSGEGGETMTKTGRFYFFTMAGIRLIVSFFILGFIKTLIDEYLWNYRSYTSIVTIGIDVLRTVSMIGFWLIIAYFVYVSYVYLTSAFYKKTKIPLHEAYFHGYFDLAYVYQRIRLVSTYVDYDTKTKAIIVDKGDRKIYILVRDIFGNLQADIKSDTWYICTKKKKEYGRINYKKKVPIKNPINENQMYINELAKIEEKTIENYVCLTGLRLNTFNHKQLNTVYELESIIQKII